MITVISICNNLFLFLPGAEAAGPQAHKDWTDEFAEGGCVNWVQFLLLTVPQVVVIEGGPGQANSLRCLVVVQKPLQLKIKSQKNKNKNWS